MQYTTFRREEAERIAKAYNGQIWGARDAFNQNIYIVKWDNDDEEEEEEEK